MPLDGCEPSWLYMLNQIEESVLWQLPTFVECLVLELMGGTWENSSCAGPYCGSWYDEVHHNAYCCSKNTVGNAYDLSIITVDLCMWLWISQFSDSECKSYDACSLSFFLASVADAVTNLRILHRENLRILHRENMPHWGRWVCFCCLWGATQGRSF